MSILIAENPFWEILVWSEMEQFNKNGLSGNHLSNPNTNSYFLIDQFELLYIFLRKTHIAQFNINKNRIIGPTQIQNENENDFFYVKTNVCIDIHLL